LLAFCGLNVNVETKALFENKRELTEQVPPNIISVEAKYQREWLPERFNLTLVDLGIRQYISIYFQIFQKLVIIRF